MTDGDRPSRAELVEEITALRDEVARLRDGLQASNRDLSQSLEQQTASAEILRAIASAPGELNAVLQAVADNASRLCEAPHVVVYRADEEGLHSAAGHGPLNMRQIEDAHILPIDRGSISGTAVLERRAVQVDDFAEIAGDYPESPFHKYDEVREFHSMMSTPLMREGQAIGTITVGRTVVKPFTDKQRVLLEIFSDQAVIAIENARLLDELNARNRDLSESLEQQTASAEILRAIASAQGEADRVLDTIAETAHRLFGAYLCAITRIEDGVFRQAAVAGPEAATISGGLSGSPVDRQSVSGRAATEMRTVHLDDLWENVDQLPNSPGVRGGVKTRSLVAAPLVRDGQAIGTIAISLSEVRPFTEKQLALLESFADQAVIAIENSRLLSELRESLDNQTAMSEVLGTISASPGRLDPVFDKMLQNAMRLSHSQFGMLLRYDGEAFVLAASAGIPSEFESKWLQGEIRMPAQSNMERMARSGNVVHDLDLAHSAGYMARHPLVVDGVEVVGVRTALHVPLVKDEEVIGAFVFWRNEVRAFEEKHIELAKNFADQAVIAIENARLLEELHESLERRTATADVLAVISSSPGDVQPVFETMLDKAVAICGASEGSVFTFSDGVFLRVASRGLTEDMTEYREVPARPNSPPGEVVRTRKTVHLPDLQRAGEMDEGSPVITIGRVVIERGGRSAIWVPMLKEGEVVGAFVLIRRIVGPFSDNQIGLVENFASQAVIAIENARLLEELRTARDAAERAVEELQEAQASLIHAEKMASLGQLTAGIAHEIKNPLNFVNNFAGLSVELLGELKETAGPAFASLADDERDDVDEVMEMLTGNLEKVAEHGKRADGIVKSMLAHSRGGSGDRQSVDLNALIEESFNLAYHGARAQDQDFNITMEREFDTAPGPIEVVPQELTRVLLNLFGNGFYAANKRARETDDSNFQPTLKVSTCDTSDGVEIRIRDNGTGIPAEFQERLFEPFFTTKPTGEGTGLGLSISYEIVTKQHGGTITVESEPGEFTEFCITLPRQTRD